jgi:hypothetical protein
MCKISALTLNDKQQTNKNEHILLDYTATDYAQNNFSLTETSIDLYMHASSTGYVHIQTNMKQKLYGVGEEVAHRQQ